LVGDKPRDIYGEGFAFTNEMENALLQKTVTGVSLPSKCTFLKFEPYPGNCD